MWKLKKKIISLLLKYFFHFFSIILQKIFIFNPQDIKYEKICDSEIKKYYEEISKNLRKNIKEDILLENLQCEDNLRNDINLSQNTSNNNKDRKVNEDLEGKQKDCPKPPSSTVLA